VTVLDAVEVTAAPLLLEVVQPDSEVLMLNGPRFSIPLAPLSLL
jgi:hypothetical protein